MKYINCALIGITILCLYVIGCVGLNIFPTLGFCQKADAINSVGLNLSYSFIAGWIFYLLITYFPYRFFKRKFSPIIRDFQLMAFDRHWGMVRGCTEWG